MIEGDQMNRIELDDLLRKRTLLEEAFLNFSSNKDMQAHAWSSGELLLDENSIRKFPFIDQQFIVDYITDPKKTFDNKTIVQPGEGIIFSCHPRFNSMPEHRHSYIELSYVYSGECHQIVNDKQITMGKGEVCILDTNVLHSIEPAGEDDIIVNCLMSKSHLDNILMGRLSGNDLLSSFFIRAIYQIREIGKNCSSNGRCSL